MRAHGTEIAVGIGFLVMVSIGSLIPSGSRSRAQEPKPETASSTRSAPATDPLQAPRPKPDVDVTSPDLTPSLEERHRRALRAVDELEDAVRRGLDRTRADVRALADRADSVRERTREALDRDFERIVGRHLGATREEIRLLRLQVDDQAEMIREQSRRLAAVERQLRELRKASDGEKPAPGRSIDEPK